VIPDFELIKELFDLPGSDSNGNGAHSTNGKQGRNREESSRLGKSALNEGDYETAVQHFKRAVEQSDEKSPWVLMDLGAAYATAGNVPQAFRQYEKAKRVQKSGELMVALASLYQQVGRSKDAIARLKEGVELEPQSAYVHYKLAEGLRKAGYKTEAIDAAQVAIACAPDQSFYHYWLGEFYLSLGQFQNAVDSLHAAIELSPGDDNLYFLVSQAFWGLDKKQEAIRSIRLASDIDTANMLYHGLLERYLRSSGMTVEADQELNRASKMDLYDQEMLGRVASKFQFR